MESIIQTGHLGVKLHPIRWLYLRGIWLTRKTLQLPCPSQQRHGLDFSSYGGSWPLLPVYGAELWNGSCHERKFWPHMVILIRYCDLGILVATGLSWIWGRRCRRSPTIPRTHRQTDPNHLVSAKNILSFMWLALLQKLCVKNVSVALKAPLLYISSVLKYGSRVREDRWLRILGGSRLSYIIDVSGGPSWPRPGLTHLVSHNKVPSRPKPGQDHAKIYSSNPPLPPETRAPLPSSTVSRKFYDYWETFTFSKSGKLCFPEHKDKLMAKAKKKNGRTSLEF